MAEAAQTLETYLQHTLSPDGDTRRQAEKFLESIERNEGYALMLLKLVEDGSRQTQMSPVALAAAITFKNFVKRNWRIVEDEPSKVSDNDRNTIKCNLVNLMLNSPEQYQKQLSEAISVIGREDFPEKWPNLLKEMVEKFQTGEFHIINGVLQTAHSLFKRYRHEFRSDRLWTEIKLVLDAIAAPLTALFEGTVNLVPQHANNKDVIKILYSSLTLISKIFYSLNYQDLPEFFEDNMKTWMTNFHGLLTSDNPLLNTDSEEEPGLNEFIKSQICDNVALYAQKYDEEFAPFLPQFVTAVWTLLTNTGNLVKYDILVCNAIGFLTSVCERNQYKSLFEDENTLIQICEKVIIPNMEFRTADEEQFEDNPEEYIRRDLEGSDIDTRRRAACDLVRGFGKNFEGPITRVFSQYVNRMLQEYASNPQQNWKNKDAAIYLVTSIAQKGSTAKHGTTKANSLVNLQEFFANNILPEISNESGQLVLKADSLRYVITFRSLLGKEALLKALGPVIKLITSKSAVVHTYASHLLERILVMKADGGKTPLLTKEDMAAYLEPALTQCFQCLTMPGSEENEYIMKVIMRTISLCQELVMPYMAVIVNGLGEKLTAVSKNPSKPHFNHYLFETLSLCIRITCNQDKSAVGSFEEALFGIFTDILQRDVTEFIPYVFQVMSLLLEVRDPPIPESYQALFPHLLAPVLWERPGNIPPLVRLLQAFIEKSADKIVEGGKLNNLLGVFQKMIASKTNDNFGFYLLNSMVEHMSPKVLEPFMKQIFSLLFQRLMKSKTTKYVRGILVFFSLFIVKNNANTFQQLIDSMQDRMFAMVLEKLVIADINKVLGSTERKICSVGITKLLTSCDALLDENYCKLWPLLLESIIGLFELPEDESVPDDEHFIEVDETPGYQTAYSQLSFAGKRESDPVNCDNPKQYLAQNLASMSKHYPGKVQGMLKSLNPNASNFLQQYMQAAQVQL